MQKIYSNQLWPHVEKKRKVKRFSCTHLEKYFCAAPNQMFVGAFASANPAEMKVKKKTQEYTNKHLIMKEQKHLIRKYKRKTSCLTDALYESKKILRRDREPETRDSEKLIQTLSCREPQLSGWGLSWSIYSQYDNKKKQSEITKKVNNVKVTVTSKEKRRDLQGS